ncbi:Tripeptidyl-peptidase SED1 [Colletotrichum fructicola]|uniref:tripeptidyl-peptidase II n=1 Tax=Colletotrichum fructicola (strain Nara gc5) TaxID=1213859 RepID=L2G1V1_COLFN|nr:Tripeptidyl-peptidase SED1 [Colletotrichum fructicola]KAF4889961.1 Tripeptidyl-peptidase SED1 [Colletotrichum fructicola]
MRLYLVTAVAQLAITLSQAKPHAKEQTWTMSGNWREAGWRRESRAPGNHPIRMDFALSVPESGISAAEDVLRAISDPSSDKFGHHLSADEVSEMFAPSADVVRQTAKWLNSAGIPRSSMSVSSDGSHIFFNTTVERAERLIDATFYSYSKDNSIQLATKSFGLPARISGHIDAVLPGIDLGGVPSAVAKAKPFSMLSTTTLKRQSPQSQQLDCFKYMTPECYRSLYNIPTTNAAVSTSQNSLGIYQPAWVSWLPEDLDGFFSRFHPGLVGQRPKVLPVNGGYLQDDVKMWPFNLESNLDHEYAMSLISPLPVTNIQAGDQFLGGNLNTMLGAFSKEYCLTGLDPNFDPVYPNTRPGGYNSSDCGVYDPPSVISVSYVYNEATFSEGYLRRQCLEYLKLGLRGVSVIVSSGDTGTSHQGNSCIDPNSGNVTTNGTHGHFTPGFPASCPWVTTVGGTQLSASMSYLNQPSLQSHLRNLSTAGYFNPRGRGFPDVSAVANDVVAYSNGKLWRVAGTSASAPVFASMVALINNARQAVGTSPVGFINPFLYGVGKKALRDVKTGWNSGCGVTQAFAASDGWDPVTGLGTPDFSRLLELYMNLP